MRIVIVKTSALGDILHAFPTLSYLRAKFPDAVIDWVVEERCRELLEGHPEINHVLRKNEIGQHSYDVLFDLQGNIKSGLLTWRAKATVKVGFGWKTIAEWPNILTTTKRYNPPPGQNIRDDYLFLAQSHFGDFSIAPKKIIPPRKISGEILVCPGSRWKNKQLPVETLTGFLQRFEGTFLFAWGTEEEREQAVRLHSFFKNSRVLEKLPLPKLYELMQRVDLVIAMDSLPLHLAGIAGTPTYSFFGASSAAKYAPQGAQHKAVQGKCPYGRTFEKRCPVLRTCPTGACMEITI